MGIFDFLLGSSDRDPTTHRRRPGVDRSTRAVSKPRRRGICARSNRNMTPSVASSGRTKKAALSAARRRRSFVLSVGALMVPSLFTAGSTEVVAAAEPASKPSLY